MRRTLTRACGLLLAAAATSMIAVGPANATSTSSSSSKSGTTSYTAKLKSTTLNGSGSSLQLGYDQVVIGDYKKIQKGVTINYTAAGKGSGTGRKELADQVTDFAGSDAPYSSSETPTIKGGPILYFPTVADPITISYNLSSVPNLQLSGETIAKIFSGQITTWDDPAIKADNPKAKLPSTKITLVVRSDSSGTSNNFSVFLGKAAPTVWTQAPSSTPTWPDGVQKGAQNTGVAQIIEQTEGAVGYVDYSDAQAIGLKYAKVKNASGKYVAPTTGSASAALVGATVNPDLTYDPLNAEGPKVYAITSPTYIIVYQNQTDANKGAALKSFLSYIYGPGQATAPQVDYAPLSPNILKQAKAQITKIALPTT
jgi:phosphate transport system substrate-binding protein